MSKTILMIGAFDVKGEEYHFVRKLIEDHGLKVITMDFGTFEGTKLFPVDVDNSEVAKAGGGDIKQFQEEKDRGIAMKAMSEGAAVLTKKLFSKLSYETLSFIV